MKKMVFLLIVLLSFTLSSCEEQSIVEPNETDCSIDSEQEKCKVTECPDYQFLDEDVCVTNELPNYINYFDQGVVLEAQDQLNLGTCAVFASTSMLESYIALTTGDLVNISEQQFILGSTEWAVDKGNNPDQVLNFILDNGVVLETELSYSVEDAKNKVHSVIHESDYRFNFTIGLGILTDLDEDEKIHLIKQKVLEHGPIATVITAFEDFDAYQDGVYEYDGVSRAVAGHWINIIGWQDDDSITNGGYWIVKNSYGKQWGENGFGKIAYGDSSGVNDSHFYYIEDNS